MEAFRCLIVVTTWLCAGSRRGRSERLPDTASLSTKPSLHQPNYTLIVHSLLHAYPSVLKSLPYWTHVFFYILLLNSKNSISLAPTKLLISSAQSSISNSCHIMLHSVHPKVSCFQMFVEYICKVYFTFCDIHFD